MKMSNNPTKTGLQAQAAESFAGPRSGHKGAKALSLIRGVGRRWRQVLGFGLVAAVVFASLTWVLLPPPTPGASAKLYIPLKPPTALGGEHPDPPLERQTQSELIRSRLVLNAAIRPQEINSLPIIQLQPDPLDWLATRVRVEFQGPEILRISLNYAEADQARLVVDAIKDSYLKYIVNGAKLERETRLHNLTKMASEQAATLARKRANLRELAKDESDTDRRLFLQRMAQDQIQATKAQLIRMESELKAGRFKEGRYSPDAPVVISEASLNQYVDSDRRVQDSAAQHKKLTVDLEDIRSRAATPTSQAVVEMEGKLAAKQKEHEELRSRVREEALTLGKNQTNAERAAKHDAIKQENMIYDLQVKQLKSELDVYITSLSDTRLLTQDLEPLRFEIKQSEDLLAKIQSMSMTLKLEEDTRARVVELEKAAVNTVDAEKRRTLFSIGAGVAGLLLVIGFFALLEFWLRRVESPEELSNGAGIRVFGTVPKLPRLSSRMPSSYGDSGGYYTQIHREAIASARAVLLHGEALSQHRVFLITSPISGEGKTTLTAHLSASLALSGRTTLVIDGDLRKPCLHERLGVPQSPGLSEILRGELSVFDAVRKTPVPGLMIITAGYWSPATSEALLTTNLDHLFSVFRNQFDFVLVDSSPALPIADAQILARHTDGVILSFMQGVSRLSQATQTCERFSTIGATILGAFINGSSHYSYNTTDQYRTKSVVQSGTTRAEAP
jgi:capsular exopolysaccharide synthesis family protein